MNVLLNIIGIALMIAIVWVCSWHRDKINWRLVAKAIAAQLILALFITKVPAGIWTIEQISDGVNWVISFAKTGLFFVFGSLSDGKAPAGFIFAIQVLGNIVFIGALISMLTYLGILGFVVKRLGKIVGRIVGTSSVESFICVANMFLGQTESPLLVAKYLKSLTKSEIVMILIAGMGSMSVSILGGYSAMGVPMDLLILTAAMVPFGSIIIGKILMPEVEFSSINAEMEVDKKSAGSNLIESMGNGALDGMKMAMAIGSSLIAIIATMAMVNGALFIAGLKLEQILGWVFYPVAVLMGFDGELAYSAGEILGCKIVFNEFVAFDMLMKISGDLDPRSMAMLCVSAGGFANLGSMAVNLSALGILCPERKSLIAQLVGRSLLGAVLMNIMNAMIVGIMLSF